ncbi:MAG: peptidylprolyl isomerase [Flavobacteriales bacterium]|jgi:peptidylprolyl isomerase
MFKIIVVVVAVLFALYIIKRIAGDNKNAKENIVKGQAFLDENAKKEGVNVTDSGLQYCTLEKGSGSEQPNASSRVKVHYHGTLIDNTVFDSSVDRGTPISFGLNQVIPGWTEGLQLMHVGDKMRLTIPSNLGYGNRASGKIPPGSVLIFDVELIEIH